MYCGSCQRDHALVKALRALGHDAFLVPLYTPVRTDDATDVSEDVVLYGGINVYLQHKWPWLRHLPLGWDRWLNRPWLLRRLIKEPTSMAPELTGAMALSMLAGKEGRQQKELERLVRWLANRPEGKPEVILFSNLLVAGCLPELRAVFPDGSFAVTLQGDDLFLDELSEPYRGEVIASLRRLAVNVDVFFVFGRIYAQKMAALLGVPESNFRCLPLGIEVEPQLPTPLPNDAPTIGYLARVCPHKGLHLLIDAFLLLVQRPGLEESRLKIAGWLGEADRDYLDEQLQKAQRAGVGDQVVYEGELDREAKHNFLSGLDVFSVPSVYEEPKGLSILEAMACGVPCVQPHHGIFAELCGPGTGCFLVDPKDSTALADGLSRVLCRPEAWQALGEKARRHVLAHHQVEGMAAATVAAVERLRARPRT